MVREVFGNTSGMRIRGVPRVLMECHESELVECHEFHFYLVLCCTVFTAHAFPWLKPHLCSQLAVCHVCCCASFSFPCQPCPLDAYATLTGIDFAHDRLGEISMEHGSGADARWYS